MQSANLLIFMKKILFLSYLLAACVTSVAQAEDSYVGLYLNSGSKTIEGDLEVNHLQLDVGATSLKVTGDIVINANLDGTKFNKDNRNIPNIIDSNKPANVYYYISDSVQGLIGSSVGGNTTLEANSITYNVLSANGSDEFTVRGTIKTNKFTVSASEGCSARLNLMASSGRIESLSEEPGILEIGANVLCTAGFPSQNYAAVVHNMNTVVNGGTLEVADYVTMSGITLESGSVKVKKGSAKSPIDLGDIVINDGTFTMEEAAIVSDMTLNGGTLDIAGNISTGALTLIDGTLNFSGDYVIDLGEESLILGDNVAITLNVDSLDNIEGVTLFKTTGNVSGLDELTVTFVDATGTEKKAAVSFSNGSVVTGTIPEPTTATLSLLALAGLAARRRRASR